MSQFTGCLSLIPGSFPSERKRKRETEKQRETKRQRGRSHGIFCISAQKMTYPHFCNKVSVTDQSSSSYNVGKDHTSA